MNILKLITFDFTQYNFDQDLSIALLAAILGIALPIIIQSMGNIDTKYGSTRLVNRVRESLLFRSFIALLLAAIGYRLYYCFLPERSVDWGDTLNLIIDQSGWIILYGLLIALIVVMIRFLYMVLDYYDPNKLIQRTIPNGFNDKNYDYNDWIELVLSTLNKYNNKVTEKTIFVVHEQLNNYIVQINKSSKDKQVVYSSNYYDALRSINKGICRMERQMSSIINASTSTNILIDSFQNTRISSESYRCIWYCLQEQLFYDRDDLVYDYWKAAYQHFGLFLKPINEYPKTANANEREDDIMQFRFFNCMLGAMLYGRGKEELIKKMFGYSNSTYHLNPLYPHSYKEIISIFLYAKKISLYRPMYFVANYPTSDVDCGVYSGDIIRDRLYVFLTLLIVRVYHMDQRKDSNLSTSTNLYDSTKTAAENRNLKSVITQIEELLKEHKECFNSLFDSYIDLSSDFAKYAKELDDNYDDILNDQSVDGELIKQIYKEIEVGYCQFVKSLRRLTKDEPSKSGLDLCEISYISNEKKDKKLFCTDQEYSTTGIADSYQYLVYQNLAISFSRCLYNNTYATIICSKDESLEVLDQLSLSADKHIVIANDIDWEGDNLNKVEAGEYSYKGITLIDLECYFISDRPCFWIMEREHLPYLKTDVMSTEHSDSDKLSDGVYAKIEDMRQVPSSDREDHKYCTETIECRLELSFSKEFKILRVPLVRKYEQMQYVKSEDVLTLNEYLK